MMPAADARRSSDCAKDIRGHGAFRPSQADGYVVTATEDRRLVDEALAELAAPPETSAPETHSKTDHASMPR